MTHGTPLPVSMNISTKMDERHTAHDDFFALFQELESHTLPPFEQSTDVADLIDLDLELLTEENGADERRTANPNTSASTSRAAAAVASSSLSHVERCRINRKRKKQELVELRASADALQAVLSQLQGQVTEHGSKCDTLAASSPWRSASKRAIIDCQKALRENNQLREMLQQQVHAARAIQLAIHAAPDAQHLLMARESPSTDGTCKRSKTSPSTPSTALTKRGELYRDLFASIHALYEQKASCEDLGWLKIGTRKISMEMVTRTDSDCLDMSVHVMECQQIPLSFTDISTSTWKHLSTPCDLEACDAPGDNATRTSLKSCGDDLFGDCGSECKPLPVGGDAPLGRLAIRRYAEANRLTFVWECDGCFQCDAARKPIGRVTERGWCTIEPSGNDPTSDAAILRIQVQYIPQSSECGRSGGCQPSAHVNLSSDLAMKLYRGTIARTFGAVESEVFKQCNRTASGRGRC